MCKKISDLHTIIHILFTNLDKNSPSTVIIGIYCHFLLTLVRRCRYMASYCDIDLTFQFGIMALAIKDICCVSRITTLQYGLDLTLISII